jgi:hypothetical protein
MLNNQESGGVMFIRVGIVVVVLICTGCGHYVDVKERNQALQSAPPTYASVAEVPFQKIDFPSDLRFSIDEKSPVLEFGDGDKSDKSYVGGFELPVRESEYRLVIRTYLLRDGLTTAAMYFPIVDLLDDEKKPVQSPFAGSWKNVFRAFSDEMATRDRWREYTQRITASLRIRYILIHTRRFLVDSGGLVWTPTDAAPQLAAGAVVPIFIPSGGSSGPLKVEGSVVGDFRIYLEEPRP